MAGKSARRASPKKKPRPKGNGHGGARPNSGGRRAGAGRKRQVRRIADYRALGNAPEDELERLRWMSAALGVRARQVMLDEQITDAKRGEELRSLAKAMNTLVTRNRLRRAEQSVLDALGRRKDTKPAPGVEPVPPVTDEQGGR